MTKENRTALITGASGGIGLEFARLFAGKGINVVLVARNAERLNCLADELGNKHGITAWCLPIDLSKEKAPDKVYSFIQDGPGKIDFLINNAGVGDCRPFLESDLKGMQDMIWLNIMAVTSLTRLFLPDMVARGWGRILNVGSLAAYQPGGPGAAVYYATKNFVLSFSRALSVELRGTGVCVTALNPGPVKTEFADGSGFEKTLLFQGLTSSPASVAKNGYRAMKWKIPSYVPGLFSKLLALAGELPPRQIALEVNRLLLKKVK